MKKICFLSVIALSLFLISCDPDKDRLEGYREGSTFTTWINGDISSASNITDNNDDTYASVKLKEYGKSILNVEVFIKYQYVSKVFIKYSTNMSGDENYKSSVDVNIYSYYPKYCDWVNLTKTTANVSEYFTVNNYTDEIQIYFNDPDGGDAKIYSVTFYDKDGNVINPSS